MTAPTGLEAQLAEATAEWNAAVDAPANGDRASWFRRLAAAHCGMAEVSEALAERAEAGSVDGEVAAQDWVAYHYAAARRAELSAEHEAKSRRMVS